ncbi:hypothetical protein T440DRAFT_186847 [Plenodomus tracheiphilus IPT5]|uniref:Uncharacterized protein n=1 Tax=Plenodomus tracheiphilus IPT5 TaxID=1408161 RepID=A0A6A7AWT2_9PLEO|nr:hypothetical protein T440DRAFT_186847 [Plenodomus tracheiphilus IPT5]
MNHRWQNRTTSRRRETICSLAAAAWALRCAALLQLAFSRDEAGRLARSVLGPRPRGTVRRSNTRPVQDAWPAGWLAGCWLRQCYSRPASAAPGAREDALGSCSAASNTTPYRTAPQQRAPPPTGTWLPAELAPSEAASKNTQGAAVVTQGGAVLHDVQIIPAINCLAI